MAKKKKNLTEVDLFYIKAHAGSKSIQEIADAVNGDLVQVTESVVKALSEKEKEVPAHQQKTKTQPLNRELFARNKERGFVAMTQSASEAGDEFRDKHGNTVGVKGNEGHIHKPFGDSEDMH
jgi:hypothetical protein